MKSRAFKEYSWGKDPNVTLELLNGYGKHNKKVVLTVFQGETLAEVYLDATNFMLIDIASLSLLESSQFTSHKRNDGQLCSKANGKCRKYAHRLIIQAASKLQVDHINHNPLDNRLINLRECTANQNSIAKRNSRVNKVRNSGYIGVSHVNEHESSDEVERYVVIHSSEGVYPKTFNCPEEAAEYRDERIADYFMGDYGENGQWSSLNFINWNFEPAPDGVVQNEAIEYDSYRSYTHQETLEAGLDWLKQQDWATTAKPFYDSYIEKYADDD